MYLLGYVGGIHTGDMIFQLLLFVLIPVVLLAGVIALFVVYRKRNNRSKQAKEKSNKTLPEKEK